jgi:hypothetical protein
MPTVSEYSADSTYPTIYVADRHSTDGVRAILGHLHRIARHRGVRPPRIVLNPAPDESAGCGPAILLLVERQPAAAEDLVAWWERRGSGLALPLVLCHHHAARLSHGSCRSLLPPVVVGEGDVLLEHGGRALLTGAAADAIDAGLAALSLADGRPRTPAACPCAT